MPVLPSSDGPGPGGSWTCASGTSVTPPPILTGRWTTLPSGVARAWCSPPRRCSTRSGRLTASEGSLPRPLVLLSPAGRRFDQRVAREYAGLPGGFTLICGRYEGVDQRIADHLADEELSVGDFVLAGGELGALVVVESVARLVPGVLGNDRSADDESFSQGLLEYPQYTRPAVFRGWEVPEVLRSGDHGQVDEWRRVQALVLTLDRRPDLIAERGGLTDQEVQLLAEHGEVRVLREHGYDW